MILEPRGRDRRCEVVAVTDETLATALRLRPPATASIWRASCRCARTCSRLGPRRRTSCCCCCHHIAGDGWSLAPLLRDLAAAYAARVPRRGARLARRCRCSMPTTRCGSMQLLGDESDPDSADRAPARLLDARPSPDLPEQLELPADRPRPAVASYRGDSVAAPARRRRCTGSSWRWPAISRRSLFMVLQAALAALLTRLGAGTDIPIGSPIAGRTDDALDDLVGFFVNTLVLRTDTSGNPSFRDLLGRVRAANLAAYAHQDLPFERLVEALNPARSLARHPLFQVMLALQNNAEAELRRCRAWRSPRAGRHRTPPSSTSRSALGERRGRRRHARWASTARSNTPPTCSTGHASSRSADVCVRLLSAVAAPERADRPTRHPRRRTSAAPSCASGTTPRTRCPHATLPELFEAQVARTPDATALVFEDAALTYAALDARANRLAHHLIGRGVGPEVMVGLCFARSVEMLVGLLAILKAGAAYLPLDPDYPADRLAFMLDDAGAPSRMIATLPTAPAQLPRIVRLDADAHRHRAAARIRARHPPPPTTPPTSSTPRAPPAGRRASSSSMQVLPIRFSHSL